MPEKDVEQLLVSLILDNRIDGHIDQVNRLLERGNRLAFLSFMNFILSYLVVAKLQSIQYSCRSKGMKKYTAIDKWNTQLRSLYQTVCNRVS